ncbi:MAG: L7Ae/L30e/S12e/Gadd45 family ribosomal protein [Bacillota bacterium]|jgi:ribosomal protein L7Ae-like RNA K-turn-binding protein
MLSDLSARDKKLANYLGLAQRAGKIAAGDNPAFKAVEKGQSKLLLVAKDAAEQIKKQFQASCPKGGLYEWQSKAVLGYAVGKSPRGALAVLDEGFAKAIKSLLD